MMDTIESKIIKNLYKETPPVSLTHRQWVTYNKEFRKRHPIHHFIFGKVVPLIKKPKEILLRVYDVIYWIRHDYCRVVRLKKINRGWHDAHCMLEHAMFEVLNEFVERELAHMQTMVDNNEKYGYNWFRRKIPFARLVLPPFRSREAGLAALSARIDDVKGVDEDETAALLTQAKEYEEVRRLYLWWNDTRPNRPDPYDASGWTKYCSKMDNLSFMDDGISEEGEIALKRLREIEKQYEEEDDLMFEKLVKIRRFLWT